MQNKSTGLQVRGYGDLVAIATLLAMLMSVVAWGLKLEDRIYHLEQHLHPDSNAAG